MADKKFNITFDIDANIAPIKTAVTNLQGALGKINIPDTFKKSIDSTFSKLNNEIENFEAISGKGFDNLADIGKAQKSFSKITDLLSKLKIQTGQLKGIEPNKFLPEENVKRTKELQLSLNKVREAMKNAGNSAEIKKQTQELAKQEEALEKLTTDYRALAAENQKMGSQKGGNTEAIKAARKEADELVAKMKELEKVKGGKSSAEYTNLEKQLIAASKKISDLEKSSRDLDAQIQKNQTSIAGLKVQMQAAEEKVDSTKEVIKQLKEEAQQTPEGLAELRQKLADLKGVGIEEIPTDIDRIGEEIDQLNAEEIHQLGENFKEVEKGVQGLEQPLDTAARGMGEVVEQGEGIKERSKEIEQLANQVKQFFSIGNTVALFKRAINSAISTVKELDAVMTQAAVVTKFSVSDMWSQLPEYAQRANELGVTIKGVYEASTLYYQQGLETTEVIGVANETLKMAKIAGLDYATATDYMTSALRGFNMEVNEMSAQKVNDIYSQLAAHTASNVEEISIAMSKTAPLAHNAGMEIETTAALLAQMIERTREAPETLGTAMKTVIARFQELKKDPALIEPVEGEIVDANKIEGALRTIGVSLRDTSGQFRELDDVFLEISQKWDSLDTNTQRYIATLAAGSRQQSRFIAMMADYKRTTDLVALANNAAGASSEQFAKTQDSLESKLNRLRTAWEQFTMGLANNQVIKAVVDLLTGFINVVNKLSVTLSGNKSIFKSLFDVGLLVGGLKLGKAAFNGFFGWLTKTGRTTGAAAGAATGEGFGSGINKALTSVQKLFNKTTWVGPSIDFETPTKDIQSLNAALQKANLTEAESAVLKDQLAAAQARYDTALLAATANIELNNDQQAASNLLQNIGISKGIAKTAALNGLTSAEIKQIVTQGQENNLTVEEIRNRIAATAAIKAQEAAEKGIIQTQKIGLLTKAKNIAMLLFGKEATRAKAMETLGMAAADGVATGAQTALNAAIAACPIGWIILGVAALTAGFILLAKAVKDNSLEGRMAAIEEQTKEAKEAADQAQQAYDDLLSDKEGYDNTQQALEELTYGTKEWKNALIKVNEQVLKLLQTYPKLASYLERGEYGQLSISEEGWDNLVKEQQQIILNTQGLYTSNVIHQKELSNLSLEKDLNENFKYTVPSNDGEYQFFDDVAKEGIRKLIDSGFVNFDETSDQLQELAKKSNFTARELAEAGKAMLEYDQAVANNQLQMENSARAFLTTAFSQESAEKVGDNAQYIIEAFSKKMAKGLENGLTQQDIYQLNGKSEWENNEKFRQLARDWDVADQMVGNDLKDLQVLYAKMSGTALETVKENQKDKKKLAKAIADMANDKTITENMNKFADSFASLGKDIQEIISFAMSGGQGYVYQQEKGLDRDQFKELVYQNSEIILEFYDSLDDFRIAYEQAILNGKKEIEKAKEPLARILNEDIFEDFDRNLDAGAISGLSQHLINVFETSGRQATNVLAESIQGIIDGLDPSDAAKFATAVNGIDWKSTGSIEGLSDKLQDLISNGTLTRIEIDNLEQQILELAKASKEVDLEKLTDQILNLNKIQYKLRTGQQERSFSEQDYKELIESETLSAEDFTYDLATDAWIYIGNSLEELNKVIIEKTNELSETQSSARSQLNSSEAAVAVRDKYGLDPQQVNVAITKYIKEAGEDSIVSLDWVVQNSFNAEELQKKWNEILVEADKLEENQKNYQISQNHTAQLEYQARNTASEKAQFAIKGDENALAALKAEASSVGMLSETYENLIAVIDKTDGAVKEIAIQRLASITEIYEEAQAWGVDGKELNDYANRLRTLNSNLTQEAATRAALANTLLESGLKEIIDSYKDWTELIDESTGLIKASGNADVTVFNNLKKSLSKMMGSTEELSEAFWNNAQNIELVKQAAEGSREAIDALHQAMAYDYITNIDFQVNTQDALNAINTFYNEIADIKVPNLEVGVQWNGEGAKQFKDAFNEMVRVANLSAVEIQKAAKAMGFNAQVKYVEETRTIPLVTTRVITQSDDNGNTETREMSTVRYKEVKGYFPVVETFTGLGTGGGNVSSSTISSGLKNAPSDSEDSGGGGGSSQEEKWENPYDWLYNKTQEINSELRTREKLERRYQRLLKTYSGSGAELKEITDQELASLEKRKKLEEEMIELRKKELKEYLAANAALAKYASINWELEVVTINWDAINGVTNPEEGEKIEKYISKLEDLIDAIKDASDTIEDIEDDIIDLQQRGKEQYRDLEDRVLAALISEQQDIIDEQERINDSINDAASDLMNAIQKNIEKLRQDRQNEETEESIAEKERRLAYLRQDTTGSNALEIKKLEEDLKKEKENYTDTLIDQALNDLKDQNDAAAKQRDKQIELMQSQLDWQEKTGYWVDEATRIVREGLGPNGIMDRNSRLYTLLQTQEEYFSKSNASRSQWDEELANSISQAFIWLQELLGNNGSSNTGAGLGASGGSGRDIMAEMIAQSNRGKSANSNMQELQQLENERNQKIDSEGLEGTWPKTYMVSNYTSGKNSYNSGTDSGTDWMAMINEAIASSNWPNAFFYAGKRDAKLESDAAGSQYASEWTFDIVFDEWYRLTGSKAFKSGGLADFTGPAWLDGTKSKPEMVLNAKDTQNFIQLKDVLAGLKSNSIVGEQGGNWYFDIDINVDEISNDYDVDKVADRIKQSIYNEATYRNVNAINFLK